MANAGLIIVLALAAAAALFWYMRVKQSSKWGMCGADNTCATADPNATRAQWDKCCKVGPIPLKCGGSTGVCSIPRPAEAAPAPSGEQSAFFRAAAGPKIAGATKLSQFSQASTLPNPFEIKSPF